MHLEGCVEYLKSEAGFQEGWLDSYDFSSPESAEESNKEIYGRFESSSITIYEKLNYSILAGEFVESENFRNSLKQLKDTISSVQSAIDIPSELDLQDYIYNRFTRPLYKSLNEMVIMLQRFERQISVFGNDEVLFDAVTAQDFHNDIPSDDRMRVLSLNLKICEIDRNLSINKKQLGELLIARQELDNFKSKLGLSYISVIYDKCNYLIRKVLYRFEQDNKTSYLYAFDFQDKELKVEDAKPGCFDFFDSITKKHYSIGSQDYSSSEIEAIYDKNRRSIELTCMEYHHLAKVYKDNNHNDRQLSNLCESFEGKYKKHLGSDTITQFDKKAYYNIRNYLLNNNYSIYVENHQEDIVEVESKLFEIKQIQQETWVNNYFPYYKFCYYLDKEIQLLFDKIDFDLETGKKLIEKFEENIKEVYIAYEWCRDRNFMAFQLPKQECSFFHEELGFDLFLSSSFVLPINYVKLEIEIKEFTRKLSKYTTLYEMHLHLKKEKEKITELKTDVEKAERNSIQILGIFSAIVLFSSANIQIFSIEGMTPDYAIKFMLAFGYALVLFIFLIWLISRDNIRKLTWIHKTFFFALAAVTIIALSFVTSNWKESRIEKDPNSATQTDYNQDSTEMKTIDNKPTLNNSK